MAPQGSIEFWNVSEVDVSVYKAGGNQHVVDLAPDASSVQATSPGEKWVVKVKTSGEEIGKVTGTASKQLYEIKVKNGGGKGTPQKSGS